MANALDIDRQHLAGLHFAKEALPRHERETLSVAEAMLRRIDAVLELCEANRLVERSEILNALGAE